MDRDSTEVAVENSLIDLDKWIDDGSFLQVPKLGEPMNTHPILQTPANEEKNPKRNREEASSSTMETTYELFELRKRPKLNPVSEKEENIESVEIFDTKTMG